MNCGYSYRQQSLRKEPTIMATKINFRTNEGRARYPRLTQADDLDDKYKTGLIMSHEDAEPLMAMCVKAGEEAFGPKNSDKLKMPFKVDEETGDVIFTMKTKYEPKFVDAKTTPIHFADAPQIYSGSRLKCVGTIGEWEMSKTNKGINLNLNKVQIIELSDGQYDDEDDGLDAVEGGFVASKPRSKPAPTNDDLDGDDVPYDDDLSDF